MSKDKQANGVEDIEGLKVAACSLHGVTNCRFGRAHEILIM